MSPDEDLPTRIVPHKAERTAITPRAAPVEPAPVPFASTSGEVAAGPRLDATARAAAAPDPATQEGGNMLPVGSFVAEFEVTKVLGEGGFGIVYLAEDHSLGRRVALKEYMPSSLAQRIGASRVSVKSERVRETFEAGLKSFVNEARLLAQFDHPSLVKVYRFWEANGTAYMVMPFYEGITLKDRLKEMGAPPGEAWLHSLLEPLTEALTVIHTERCYHRDIAPDNVILLKGSQRPLLLDFGAARRVIGDMTQALTVILKPGYAPVEQYAEVPGMKQGPWTDVYALAAVVHFAIMGKTPPTSVGRLMNDSYVPLTQAAAGRYSREFLAAIDRALIVKPEQRTPSIEALRRDLGMEDVLPGATPVEHRGIGPSTMAASLESPTIAARKSRLALLSGIGVLLVLAVAAGLYITLRSKPEASTNAAAATTAVPTTAVSPALVTPSTRPNVDVPSAAASPVAPPAAGATVPPAPAQTVAAAFIDPKTEFERVVAAQSPDFKVEAAADKPQLRIDKDKMSFKVKSEKGGHLYVFQHGTDGAILQIFPNAAAKNNQMRAESTLSLPPPQGEWALPVGGPPGVDHLIAIVSMHPRDFSALGFKVRDGFGQTSLDVVRAAAQAAGNGASVFAGRPICERPCTDDYGAASFSAEETK